MKKFTVNINKNKFSKTSTRGNLRYEYWTQQEANKDQKQYLIDLQASLIKVPKKSRGSNVILHRFIGKIEEHSDRMCRKTLLVPLKLNGKVIFHCGKEKTLLQENVVIQFDDYLDHRVECEDKNSWQTVATVDYNTK